MSLRAFLLASYVLLLSVLVGIAAAVLEQQRFMEEVYPPLRHEFELRSLTSEALSSAEGLTRTSRLFVETGNPRYLQAHQTILGVRQGLLPRPQSPTVAGWYMSIGNSIDPADVLYWGDKVSFNEMIARSGLSADTKAAFGKFISLSDDLAQLEIEAMNAVLGLVPDKAGDFTIAGAPDPVRAEAILNGDQYLAEKSALLESVRTQVWTNPETTFAEIDALSVSSRDIQRNLTLWVGAAAITLLLFGYLVHRRLLGPMQDLMVDLDRVARGGRAVRVPGFGTPELSGIAQTLNGVLAETESEVAKRASAESAERRAREIAERANVAKGEFLAIASHEMRTPLNAILGEAELTLTANPSSEFRDSMGVVQQSAESLLGLVNDLLDLERIDAGRLEVLPTTLDLRRWLDQFVAPWKKRADDVGLKLDISIDPSLPDVIVTDGGRLRQVVVNLLGNALKFTHEGSVAMSLSRRHQRGKRTEQLVITVSDTGIGIDPGVKKRLFNAFTQGDGSINRRYGGSGLGLVIARRLVILLGGRIFLRSRQGQGTCIFVVLPLQTPPPVSAHRPVVHDGMAPVRTSGAPRRSFRILAVEDHPASQEVLRRMLIRLGHTVHLAGNGLEALAALSDARFDLVLMDVRMPDVDGLTATREWREREATLGLDRTPIAGVSANATPEDERRGYAAGMDAYMRKPYRLADLVRVIGELVRDPAVE